MRITSENGKLNVPADPEIVYIEGDGVGKEITERMIETLDAAVRTAYSGERRIEWRKALAGGEAIEKTGTNLPDETIEAIKESLIAIKGPLMTPVGKGSRSINVALRQTLDLYACVRPIEYFEGVPSPVRHPENVDMVVFRENTEDIYAGIEWDKDSEEVRKVISFLQNEMGVKKIRFPETSAIGVKPVSEEGSVRLIKAAIDYAIANRRRSVTLVHKGNIMKFTEGGFRRWGYEMAKTDYGAYEKDGKVFIPASRGDIEIKDCICDAFLQNILLRTGAAVFEATHGTAPDIAGKDIVNPLSIILSGVMMLEYIGWNEAAALIRNAVSSMISSGSVTKDLYDLMIKEGRSGKCLSTSAFTSELINKL